MEYMEKLLSLVVPTYNMEKYIARCLDTVTDDSIPATLEVIVVNDGSTDNSLGIIREYEKKRPDIITVIDKANGHYGSCINAALAIAKGKYLRMLDADDWMDTQALAELLKRLETCDTDLFVTLRTEYRVKKNGEVDIKKFPFDTVEYNKVYKMQDFEIEAYAKGREFNMHSMAYRTEILREVGLKHIEGICYTDIQYCFLPIDRIKDFIVFDLYLYYYFIGRGDQSTSARSLIRNYSHVLKVISFVLDYMDKSYARNSVITVSNQRYFLSEIYNMFINSLRWHKPLTEEEYAVVEDIVTRAEKYGAECKIMKKFYFIPYRVGRNRKLLNMTLSSYQNIHFQKKKRFLR